LPRIREEIQTEKKLTFNVYQALRKATYKPGAFFKGIVLPLAEVCCSAPCVCVFSKAH
jgi:essential nuclear protein 1